MSPENAARHKQLAPDPNSMRPVQKPGLRRQHFLRSARSSLQSKAANRAIASGETEVRPGLPVGLQRFATENWARPDTGAFGRARPGRRVHSTHSDSERPLPQKYRPQGPLSILTKELTIAIEGHRRRTSTMGRSQNNDHRRRPATRVGGNDRPFCFQSETRIAFVHLRFRQIEI